MAKSITVGVFREERPAAACIPRQAATGYGLDEVVIRHDYDGHQYLDDPTQNRGPHFNWGDNHYDYVGDNKPFGILRR